MIRVSLPETWRWRFQRTAHRLIARRQVLAIGVLAALAPTIAVLSLRGYSAWEARGQIYSIATVPERPVAIVFGALVYSNGDLSSMLADRVKTGAELYLTGKVRALLLTGDNHIVTYNEPEAMRRYALNLGVPSEAIILDYAGFRTYDSCYRARDIFKVEKAILVTQAFHLDRALLTCNQLGVEAVGVAADAMRPEGYTRSAMVYSQMREFPSTLMTVVNLLRGDKPTLLGDPLPIFPTSHG